MGGEREELGENPKKQKRKKIGSNKEVEGGNETNQEAVKEQRVKGRTKIHHEAYRIQLLLEKWK